jgi:hypothetical protein
MKKVASGDPRAAREAIDALFEEFPPVLIETRFPGAAPDWYLFETRVQFDELLGQLGPLAELHVNSVWDLTNEKKAEIVVTRGDLAKATKE